MGGVAMQGPESKHRPLSDSSAYPALTLSHIPVTVVPIPPSPYPDISPLSDH